MSAGRALAWGLWAVASYLAAAVTAPSLGLPGRVLFDGVMPLPPYRWARPPLELAPDNVPPEQGTGTLTLTASGSSPGSVSTGDGQCSAVLDERAVAAAAGEHSFTVTLTQSDPNAVAPPPPGLRFDGNACRGAAAYDASHRSAAIRTRINVVLRYATGGTQLLTAGPDGWAPVRTVRYPGSLQLLVAETTAFGTFAPAAPRDLPYRHGTLWLRYVPAAAVVAAGALLFGWTRLRSRRRGNSRRPR